MSDDKKLSPRQQKRNMRNAVRRDALVKKIESSVEAVKPTGRATSTELEDRRAAVVKLRLRGHSFEDIAERLEISSYTARRDWETLRLKEGEEVKDFDKGNFAIQTVMSYDDVFQAAWDQFERAAEGSKMKLDALKEVRSTLGDKIKAMKELGIIADTPQEVNHNHISVGVINQWTPEFQQQISENILNGMLTPQLAAPVPDIEDYEQIVEAEEVKEDGE